MGSSELRAANRRGCGAAAVSLSLGILASVFTAVFVSRTLYMLVLLGKDRVQALSI